MPTDEHEPTRSHLPPTSEDSPTMAAGSAGAPPRAALPASIAGYRIVGRLGEGGMGIVFEAEQENPRRRVALKVIRGGAVVDDARVRMFQREAATLARLRHPNIGAIYAAGRTETGEDWFAMELVRGPMLDEFVARRPAPPDRAEIRYRVRLAITICEAVHYAHQRGVIHRDLKPSNIIVAEQAETASRGGPDVKILDFGLARITEADHEAGTALTEVGVIKGTLPYMSPEQARGESELVDVRTDVYALGVILYEMLTGARPYELPRSSIAQAVKVICEQPATPLARNWGAGRGPDADLQTIVGKALEKEADRRYGSAQALADDLTRYVEARPIAARPPSAAYQLRKFAERNRALVAGAAATLVALLAGIVATTAFGLREAEQRRAAEQAQKDTQTVVEFQAAMLGAVDAQLMGRRIVDDLATRLAAARRVSGAGEAGALAAEVAFRAGMAHVNATDAALRVIDEDILQRAVAAADSQFAARPRLRAQLLTSIGATYLRLGLYERSVQALTPVHALLDSVSGPEARETLVATRQLANAYLMLGDLEQAEPLLRAALAGQQRTLGAGHTEALQSLSDLCVVLTDAGRLAESESLYVFAAPLMEGAHDRDDPEMLSFLHGYGWTLSEAGKFAAAESLMVPALAGRRRVLGEHHPETMQTLNNLAVLYRKTDRTDLAVPLMREDLEVSRRQLGDEHPEVLVSMCNLGRALNAQKAWSESEPLLDRCVALSLKVLPPGYIGTGIALIAHAEALAGAGRPRDSERQALAAYRLLLETRGPEDPGARRAASVVADAAAATDRPAVAAEWRARAGAPR